MWPILVIASPSSSPLCLQINLDMSQRLFTQGSKSVPSKFGISSSGSSQSQSSDTLTAQAHGYRTKKDSLQSPSQAQQEDPKQAPQAPPAPIHKRNRCPNLIHATRPEPPGPKSGALAARSGTSQSRPESHVRKARPGKTQR